MVEDIEEVRSELDSHTLLNRDRTGKRQIETVVRVALARVSRRISIQELKVGERSIETVNWAARIGSGGRIEGSW